MICLISNNFKIFTRSERGPFFFGMKSVPSFFSAPWPDPNSPILSKMDFGVPLTELFKWLEIRDIFLIA